MGASFFKAPELKLDQEEAHLLAVTSAKVAELYDFVPDPRMQAWVAFGGALAAVYGPRIVAVSNRKKHPPKPPAPAPMSNGHAEPAPVVTVSNEPTLNWTGAAPENE